MTSSAPAIMWFRSDLRLDDNPVLAAALESGRPVIPLFILDDATPGTWRRGGASRWWLYHALKGLEGRLGGCGLRLVLRRGEAGAVLREVIGECDAGAVFWNRRYEPHGLEQDKLLKAELQSGGLEIASFNATLGKEPWTIRQKDGGPYKVFTPFARAWLAGGLPPLPASPAVPDDMPRAPAVLSLELEELDLLPRCPDWSAGLAARFTPGEEGARERLATFLDEDLLAYDKGRDFPGRDGVSRLSPHLHHGEIDPRRVIHAAAMKAQAETGSTGAAMPFIRQVIWRDFAHHTLFHFPQLPEASLRPAFEAFPWVEDDAALGRWQAGRTGFPLVDAGMRELWRTGYMHNRVRMIVGSFLVKDLRIRWLEGARWFWDTLVDADLANNSMGWQWVAGAGIDAAPWFRIFNPTVQSERFEAASYIRSWVPELAALPDRYIHEPAAAPAEVLAAAGIELGRDYPRPMVDHKAARLAALEGYEAVRAARDEGSAP